MRFEDAICSCPEINFNRFTTCLIRTKSFQYLGRQSLCPFIIGGEVEDFRRLFPIISVTAAVS